MTQLVRLSVEDFAESVHMALSALAIVATELVSYVDAIAFVFQEMFKAIGAPTSENGLLRPPMNYFLMSSRT